MADNVFDTPLSCTIVFPRVDSIGAGGESYTVIVLGTGHAGTHVIHSTAIAFSIAGGAPLNVTELNALATKIAGDWYAWRLGSLEVRYESAVPWIADGFNDIEWIHGPSMLSTIVHRSEWEPDTAAQQHSGMFGSKGPGVPVPPSVPVPGTTPIAFTKLCLLQCDGSQICLNYPTAWIVTNGSCLPPPPPPVYPATGSCGTCTSTPKYYCVSFAPVTMGLFFACNSLAGNITLTYSPYQIFGDTVTLQCSWTGFIPIPDGDPAGSQFAVNLNLIGTTWFLYVFGSANGQTFDLLIVSYSAPAAGWDCSSPLVFTRGPDVGLSFYCINWPTSVTVIPGICAGGTGVIGGLTPTVAFNQNDICTSATTLTVNGSNFTPTGNTVTLSSGTATATFVSPTELSLTSMTGISAGALTATITNSNGTSTPAIQIAYVEAAPTITSSTATVPHVPIKSFTFYGTGFNNSPTVQINGSTSGFLVQSFTDTSITVDFTVAPSTGSMTANVTTPCGTVGPTQVATVTAASVSVLTSTDNTNTKWVVGMDGGGTQPTANFDDLTVGSAWLDHFTDTNGTALTSHTPDTHPGGTVYTVWFNGSASLEIQSGKAQDSVYGAGNIFDPGLASSSGTVVASVKFTILNFNFTQQGLGLVCRVQDNLAVSGIMVNVVYDGTTFTLSIDSAAISQFYEIGSTSTVLSLSLGTQYTLTVTDTGTSITATVA